MRASTLALVLWVVGGVVAAGQQFVDLHGKRMQHPTVINLLWDDDWDRDHGGAVVNRPAAMSRDNIERFNRFLVDSSYFHKAAQYGVEGMSFGGTYGPNSACGALKPAATITTDVVDRWVHCRVAHPATDVPRPQANDQMSFLYVVYLPAGTMVDDGPLMRACGDVGYHASTLMGGYVFAVIFTACQHNFAEMTTTISHELVEAMTDPYGTGWRDPYHGTEIDIPEPNGTRKIFTGGEVADACQATPGPAFFGFNVESYFSNSDGKCIVGDETRDAFTASIQIQPQTPSVLQRSRTGFSVMPADVPVHFSFNLFGAAPTVRATDPPSIGPDGVLYAGSGGGDYILPVVADATDGSGRRSSTNVLIMQPVEIQPANVTLTGATSQQFSVAHNLPVLWTVQGQANGTIDPQSGVYTAPTTNDHLRMVEITATAQTASPRPAGHAVVLLLPTLYLRASSNDPVVVGGTLGLQVPNLYGVCNGNNQRECLRIYPGRAHVNIRLSPAVGHMGEPSSAQRKKYVGQLLAARPGDLEDIRKQIQAIDTTYHAPTVAELKRAGISPDKPIEITVTAETMDTPKIQTASVKILVVPNK